MDVIKNSKDRAGLELQADLYRRAGDDKTADEFEAKAEKLYHEYRKYIGLE
jgi:hypothetical protein